MDPPSPIKTWIHKHSPLKSRNKPLPPPPPDSSPSRNPVEPVSGNTSPSKPRTTNRFLSLLKPKPKPLPASPPNAHNQRTPIHKNTFRSGRGRTPDLKTVSKKISSLEAQLKEAQRELSAIASQQQQSSRDEVTDIDREITQRQENLSQGGRFDGLVESLLEQSHPSQRPVTRRGLPGTTPNAFLDYQAAEDAYEPAEPEADSPQANQLKRKRSEPSWQEMQERIAEFQKQQQQPQPDTKKIKRTLDPPQYSRPARQSTKPMESENTEFHELDESDASDVENDAGEQLTALPQIRSSSKRARIITVTATSSQSSRRLQPAAATETTSSAPSTEEEEKVAEAAEDDDELSDTLAPLTPSRMRNNDVESGETTVSAAQRAAHRRAHLYLPAGSKRLSKVVEEFEWNDEEIF